MLRIVESCIERRSREVAMDSAAIHEKRRRMVSEPPAGPTITVTTTYLQIPSRAHFRPALVDDSDVQVIQAHNSSASFYRFLYGNVGRDYHWIDRLAWSDDDLHTHLSRPTTTLLVLY